MYSPYSHCVSRGLKDFSKIEFPYLQKNVKVKTTEHVKRYINVENHFLFLFTSCKNSKKFESRHEAFILPFQNK